MFSRLLALFKRRPAKPATRKSVDQRRSGTGTGTGASAGAGVSRRSSSAGSQTMRTGPEARGQQRAHDQALATHTLEWLKKLPHAARPQAVANRYPRICNHLALIWSDDHLVERYFDSLLIDNRGGRRGFPPDVGAELIRLHEFFERNRTTKPGTKAWDDRMMAVGDR